MKIETTVVGDVQTNCYFIMNEETRELLVVDPGAAAGKLTEKIQNSGYQPVGILLTHGHFDHATDAGTLAQQFKIPVYAHEAEKDTLEQPQINLSAMTGRPVNYHADIYVKDEQELRLAGFVIRVLYTPGHTSGGCCYYLPYENVVFSGDTLFCQSIGRTDFPGGNASVLVRSIREKLMVLPENTKVYPGHEEETSIEQERMYNPYI